jgi:hypothetical protein
MTKFKSQICTSREQSKRLLALGLKPETADMSSDGWNDPVVSWGMEWSKEVIESGRLPAWSLGRLFALVNGEDWRAEITLKDERYGIHYGYESYWYDDIFESVIAWIENDIKEGYFNKKYLKEENS